MTMCVFVCIECIHITLKMSLSLSLFSIGKHFCFCLVILVLSTLQSMVLTRLAKCGTLWPCSLSKSKDSLLKDTDNEEGKLFHSSVISVTHRAKYIFMVSKEDVNKPPY